MTQAIADLLDSALVARDEQRWKTIAFVHRHEIAAALRSATPQPGQVDKLREALERWRDNLKITQSSPVVGDVLHGPALDFVIEQLDALLSTPAEHPRGHLPDDVVRLVIAAREIAFNDWDGDSEEWEIARKELDQASEAFAERVPWDNDPERTDHLPSGEAAGGENPHG